ncbi:energy transducer TonB [Sphingomonas sp. dw_22]|uniref:energy transducer TonB n=1 Tax=Sphingomonas sp. dw_22 TaxID=2721175 RepID=UPI001BD1C264
MPTPRHRYVGGRNWRSRMAGMSASLAVQLAVALAFLVQFNHSWSADVPRPAAPSLTVTLLPLAAPPEPVQERQADKPVQQHLRASETRPVPQPQVQIPRSQPAPPPEAQPVAAPSDPAPASPAAAPPSLAAPPAPVASSNARRNWQGEILARLARFRRYPAGARARRAQGVAYVRFRMDRGGHVLSLALDRSSGATDLDRAAMETVRRADPLPRIPDDLPDEVELSVPVEFLLR